MDRRTKILNLLGMSRVALDRAAECRAAGREVWARSCIKTARICLNQAHSAMAEAPESTRRRWRVQHEVNERKRKARALARALGDAGRIFASI